MTALKKAWSGRFDKELDNIASKINASIGFDQRLYRQDILGSIAHARMLGGQGIIPVADSSAIIAGLESILMDIEAGKVAFSEECEDIHMNIEALLVERIGVTGKKLHTGRSRNDQVALDMRMYVRDAAAVTITKLKRLETVLLDIASHHLNTVMPGYTHMQVAQPVTLAHHLMAYFEMFKRDILRFLDCSRRLDAMPLGSGALAATTYPLDRKAVASELGFSAITANSMDAVSDRDFCIEFVFCASMVMMHLSRFCEELVLWSTAEFGFVEMDEAYSTGSSIMPQKKNPDMAELVRGKSGRVYGSLMGLLTLMKSLPLCYNKDMQEDKEQLFDAYDTLSICLDVFTGMIASAGFNEAAMKQKALSSFSNATDCADYLVKKGLPFREAHEVTGLIVRSCIEKKIALLDLSLEDYQSFSPLFGGDIFTTLSLQTCIEGRSIPGGPAPSAAQDHMKMSRKFLAEV